MGEVKKKLMEQTMDDMSPQFKPDGSRVSHDVPVKPPSKDGYYPRCVFCNGENYAPAVVAYSMGLTPCAAAGGCGKYLPVSYRKTEGVE